MGSKAVEPKLYLSFSLDAAVPANHIVRRLAAAVDFGFVRSLTKQHYSNTGQPSVDPVVLFKLWLLGYLFNIRSERRLCEEAGLNLAWRWFLGYELDEALPDHSVLTKARRRFGTRVYELFFKQIVQLCEQRGLVQGDVLFIDSTLSDANAARDTLRSRALAGPRLPEPTQFVKDLFALNQPAPEPEPPRAKGGTGPAPGDLAEQPTLRSSLVSTTDPDAELATRHNGRSRLVYKTQVVVDGGKANIITAVDVGAAGDSDASSVGKMLDKHQLNLGRAPRELVGDSGYGTEIGLRECEARGILPTLNQKRKGNNTGLFQHRRFHLPRRPRRLHLPRRHRACSRGRAFHARQVGLSAKGKVHVRELSFESTVHHGPSQSAAPTKLGSGDYRPCARPRRQPSWTAPATTPPDCERAHHGRP